MDVSIARNQPAHHLVAGRVLRRTDSISSGLPSAAAAGSEASHGHSERTSGARASKNCSSVEPGVDGNDPRAA